MLNYLIEALAWEVAHEAKTIKLNQSGGLLPYTSLFIKNLLLPELATVFILTALMDSVRRWFKIDLVDTTLPSLVKYELSFLPVILLAFVVFNPFTESVRYLVTEFPNYSFGDYWYNYIIGTYTWEIYFRYMFPVVLIGYSVLNLPFIINGLRGRRAVTVKTVTEELKAPERRSPFKLLIYELTRKWLPGKYQPWVLLVMSVGLIAWLTNIDEEIRKPAFSGQPDMLWDTLLRIPFKAFGWGIYFLLEYLHYRLLFKPILLRRPLLTGHVLLYLFWLGIIWRVYVYHDNNYRPVFTPENAYEGLFFVFLCVAFGLYRSRDQRQKITLTQQRTQAELDALKAQVNPHFLFNSLNNIYGTAILEASPRTAESIQQLSGIIRYVMEESRLQTTDIQRELRFIDDFLELQRIRLPQQDNIRIEIDISWDEKPARIVPLLLNPLIENAFKYGISIQHPCLVRIGLRVQEGTLQLTTQNSILPRTNLEKGTGLGLANVRQRLALAYPNRHELTVEEADETFLTRLTIRL